MMSYLFYLSYSRCDFDSYLRRFFDELSEEVRNLSAATKKSAIGFFDQQNIEIGAEWSAELQDALHSSCLLVAACSPAYFNSEYLGKEWQLFRMRAEEAASRTPGHIPRIPILPVLWQPIEESSGVPPAATPVFKEQADHYGEVYGREGLRYLMKLTKYKESYWEFLHAFARDLVDAAAEHQLPLLSSDPPLEKVSSAFHNRAGAVGGGRDEGLGPDFAKFVLVAGRRDEMSAVREEVDGYGARAEDWMPYYPAVVTKAGLLVTGAAVVEHLNADFIPPVDDVVGRLKQAAAANTISVVVVDVWALLVKRYKQILREFDRVMLTGSAVIIVWNERDGETARNRPKLEEAVQETFRLKSLASDRSSFLNPISSPEEFLGELGNVMSRLRVSLMERAKLARVVSGEHETPFPKLPKIVVPGNLVR